MQCLLSHPSLGSAAVILHGLMTVCSVHDLSQGCGPCRVKQTAGEGSFRLPALSLHPLAVPLAGLRDGGTSDTDIAVLSPL